VVRTTEVSRAPRPFPADPPRGDVPDPPAR
jgi:hypothetical protein